MDLDRTDKKLLNLVQREFPLTREPYADLGRKLGIEGDEVITRIEQLRVEGIIRQISPVLDARSLGYKTALAAVKVPPLKLDRAERIIREHPGVSHGYERDHSFNLWFTLATPPGVDIEAELRQLISRFEPESALALPAIKIFKIGVFFDVCGDDQVSIGTMARPVGVDLEEVALSPTERLIIKELQQDLPLLPAPFATMAAHLHMDLNHFLAQCQSLLRRGIVRRFGASLNHTKAGFKANAMACWVAPPDKVEVIGRRLAALPEVTHCYERRVNARWQYNLFAMIHGHTIEDCQGLARDVSRETDLTDYVLLFSTKEFKKERIKYLV